MFRYNPKDILIQELRKSQRLFDKLTQTLNDSSTIDNLNKSISDIETLINYINKLTYQELQELLEDTTSSPKVFRSDKDKSFFKKMKNQLEEFIDKKIILEQFMVHNIENTYIHAIKIKNYFSIKEMEITDLKGKKEIYFVGENGDGKTILLQAILLALKKEYSGVVLEHIRTLKNMNLSVKDEYSSDYNSNANIKNVFAYGINRNKVDSKLFDTYGYSGLFDTSDPRKTTYLKDPFFELGREYKGDNDLIKEFIDKLNSSILKEDYQLFKGGDVDFNELSEGYKSTVIWLYDLLSRLIENQKDSEEKVEELKDFKAIVLIDEIDLYLHPKWKYDFVYNLREVFENIQFIMTTHSLVTILGASKEAVFYKVYKEDGETKISKQIDDISYYTSDILMSSPLFNLQNITSRSYTDKLSNDDYVYNRIHKKIKERLANRSIVQDDEVDSWLDEEFEKEFGDEFGE